ncbi:HAD family hydrolase [Gymnodinialimonas sp. 2305UL16-5]|uniref:sulfotransferase-like domain-containing protein n=1 Tax=Gymnodinialimonas mytili TaxID=3126503 RepID=UPI0030ADC16F
MKIAVWSGPRNLSTALMYAFGNRPDCEAVDEPFYAAYLAQTGIDHPMRQEILANQAIVPHAVVERLLRTSEKPHLYAKMMCHHMVDNMPLDWAEDFVNVHLIRHPARVIASYTNKRDRIAMQDIGCADVERIFEALPGPIIDSADIRANPEGTLRALCDTVGLAFDPAMLSWPAGPKPFDGVWARHWYDAVHCSTGFAAAEGPLPEVPDDLMPIYETAMPIYRAMYAKRLSV